MDGWIYLPGFRGLLNPANPIGMLVGVKLLLLAGLAWHIRGITTMAIAFGVGSALIRLGGTGLSWARPGPHHPADDRARLEAIRVS